VTKRIAVLFIIIFTFTCCFSEALSIDSSAIRLQENFYGMKKNDISSLDKVLGDASKNISLTDDIEILAFYNIDFDFTKYMKKSALYKEYLDLREAIESESFDSKKKDLFSLQALILSRRFDEYKDLKKSIQNSKEIDYLDMLCALFSSDFEEYQKILSFYLSKYKDDAKRPLFVRYHLMASYISDGEIFLQHFKGKNDKTRLLASIIAKETPLMYEMYLAEGASKSSTEIKKSADKNAFYSAEILLIDYYYGILNRDEINNFVMNHTKFPLNQFLMELK
jgi:hypothetical protein